MTSKLIVVRTLFVYEFFVLKDYYYLLLLAQAQAARRE